MRRLELGSSKLPWGRASLHESGTSSEWDEYVHDLHQLRLKHVRADVKQHMKTPRSLIIHQRMNQSQSAGALKKSSQQEERYQEIERANRALLNRLSSVMRKPGDITGMVNATANQTTHATLNEGFRKKELKRIDNENDKLIQMIERGESSYSRKKMSKDRKQQEKYLKNLSRYRNGPQPTALRTTPKMKKPSKKRGRGRLRAKSQKSINNQSNEDFTGYADWRRQKHQRKKKWSQSLPPLENDGGSMLQSQSSPGISFESDMHVGHTTITETTLNGPRGGGRQYQQNNQNQNQNNHRHNQSPNNNNNNNNSPSPNKNKKERVKLDIGQAAVPNHTKVFEAGRQMNGVFAVVSAITRGPSLIIQAFVPEDQTTTEVEVTPAQAKYAMRNISADIFRPERREDLCRALVAKVEFFFKDSKRMLLFNKTSQNGDSALAPSIKKDELLFQTPPEEDKNQQKSKNKKNSPKSTKSSPKSSSSKSSSPKPTASSPNSTSKRRSDQEEELDEEEEAQMNALEGVFQLIQGYVSGSTILKSKWIESVNSSDRVKSVLR